MSAEKNWLGGKDITQTRADIGEIRGLSLRLSLFRGESPLNFVPSLSGSGGESKKKQLSTYGGEKYFFVNLPKNALS